MTDGNHDQRAGFDVERSLAATSFNGTYQAIGSAMLYRAVVIIFDNQADVAAAISVDAVNVWKTFSAGEVFVLDLRANLGTADNFGIDIGTQFYTNAAAGTTGSFRISVIYAR